MRPRLHAPTTRVTVATSRLLDSVTETGYVPLESSPECALRVRASPCQERTLTEHVIRIEHRLYEDDETTEIEPAPEGLLLATIKATPTTTVELEASTDSLVDSWAAVLDAMPPTCRAALTQALSR